MSYVSNKHRAEIDKKFVAIIYNTIDRTINKISQTLKTKNMLYMSISPGRDLMPM